MDWEESAETTPGPRSVGTDMWSVLTPVGRGHPERERLELGSPAEDSLAVFDLVAAGLVIRREPGADSDRPEAAARKPELGSAAIPIGAGQAHAG